MSSTDDISAQQELLAINRRNLQLYLEQRTKLGGSLHVTPSIANGMYEARESIRHIKGILRTWGVVVEDHPDDDEYAPLVRYARDKLVSQLFQYPRRFLVVLGVILLLAIAGLGILLARTTSLVGIPIGFLGPLVRIVCPTIELPTSVPFLTLTPISASSNTLTASSIVTFTSTPREAPPASTITTPAQTPAIDTSCITTGNNLRVRDRPHPGQLSNVLFTLNDRTNVKPLARDRSGAWIKVQVNGTEGWVSAQYVECARADNLPFERGLDPLIPTPTRTRTPTDIPIAGITPPPTTGSDPVGRWVGQTAQGQPISFQVTKDSFGSESVVNLTVAYQFEASCPLGTVTFTSQGAAHIFWAPDNSFRFLNLAQKDTSANVDGAFTSNTEVAGQLRVTSSVWLHDQCSFTEDRLIPWHATKQNG